jgi:hypothetical protein
MSPIQEIHFYRLAFHAFYSFRGLLSMSPIGDTFLQVTFLNRLLVQRFVFHALYRRYIVIQVSLSKPSTRSQVYFPCPLHISTGYPSLPYLLLVHRFVIHVLYRTYISTGLAFIPPTRSKVCFPCPLYTLQQVSLPYLLLVHRLAFHILNIPLDS